MSAIPWISFSLIFIIVIGMIIFQVRKQSHLRKLDITANMPFIDNTPRRSFTNGYSMGVLKSIKPRKNGCSLIEFLPIDVEQGENIERPNVQSVVVKNEYIRPFARGELSPYREIIKLISRHVADYPEKMRDTTEGEWMAKEGQLGFIKSALQHVLITQGDEALAESLKEYSRTGIGKSALAEIKQINAQSRKLQMLTKTETEEKQKGG